MCVDPLQNPRILREYSDNKENRAAVASPRRVQDVCTSRHPHCNIRAVRRKVTGGLMSNQLPIPPELIAHLNRGECVLFVGDALDGVSQSARLAAALADACGAHCPFCQDAGECQRPDDCAVPPFRAAQLYEGHTNRQALVDFVCRHVDSTCPPTPLHRALLELPVRVIITTAYDDRLEAALRAAGGLDPRKVALNPQPGFLAASRPSRAGVPACGLRPATRRRLASPAVHRVHSGGRIPLK